MVQKGNMAVAAQGGNLQNEPCCKAKAAVFDVVALSGICGIGELDEVIETRGKEPTGPVIKTSILKGASILHTTPIK
jgi:hypothetical protein